ncbi:hypothetical protein [Leifsonia sp. P73]|uniref:hypothetical protein n=1 Tax=Leifsonia sp. P73 TaxID=3423959 RepID=UPI003DA1F314
MTITVAGSPTFSPPRNTITLQVPAGNVMKNPVLTRIVGGVATATRSQPAPGFDTQVIQDYEMPYDQSVSYEFVTDYFNPAGTTVWDETWSSTSAWSGATGSFTVASGKASCTLSSGSATITRAVASGSYRVMVASLTATSQGSVVYPRVQFSAASGSNVLQLVPMSGGGVGVTAPGVSAGGGSLSSPVATGLSGSSPVTVDFLGTSIVLTGTLIAGGASTFTITGLSSTDFATVAIVASFPAFPGTTTVGEIKVTAYPTTTHLDQTATPSTISPTQPWLIHPANPGLSMPMSSRDRSTVSIRNLGDITNDSITTEHQILGAEFPITTTSGPRLGNKLQMVVGVRTAAQEQALRALLKDGTPLLFRAPASYPIGLDEGFYSVGQLTRGRLSQRLGDPMRNFTLPLTQVQSPAVGVANTGWSWAALAAQFPTWQAVAAAFNTWADVLTNNRKPGY